ncbi:hypothetical protein Bca52824_016771 [Brassica carinata]|uniref:Uncharacterized protein n=1 Tax=Brassica carinata TaxID=52824 RepID=A0A8X8B6R0_BRACI|nr:hypothetical protein Bca52824_016771 [Brassica carinata]
MKQGDSSVGEYNTLFLKSGLHGKHGEETLVIMYREGLREDIRSEIGSRVFSTIDDIMQAALDVEEGSASSDTNGSPTEFEESENRPKKKARTEHNNKYDPEDEEEEDEADEEQDDADNASD